MATRRPFSFITGPLMTRFHGDLNSAISTHRSSQEELINKSCQRILQKNKSSFLSSFPSNLPSPGGGREWEEVELETSCEFQIIFWDFYGFFFEFFEFYLYNFSHYNWCLSKRDNGCSGRQIWVPLLAARGGCEQSWLHGFICVYWSCGGWGVSHHCQKPTFRKAAFCFFTLRKGLKKPCF